MKKIIVISIILIGGLIFPQCSNDLVFQENSSQETIQSFSKADCENQLKRQINNLMLKGGKIEKNFIGQHGFPLWKKARWVSINSKEMLVVPLVSGGISIKYIIGVVEKGKINAIVTEQPNTKGSPRKIYSLNNKLLYEEGVVIVQTVRVKSEDIEEDYVTHFLKNGGSAEELFEATHGGEDYNPEAKMGAVAIVVGNVDEDGSSLNTSGHAWIQITAEDGTETTFSLWGNREEAEYIVNEELRLKDKYSDIKSLEKELSYEQFQAILDWNKDPDHTDWKMTHNCSSYSMEIWKLVSGEEVESGLLDTPSDIYNYITEKEEEAPKKNKE